MSENPDNIHYLGFGPQAKLKDSEGNEMEMDQRYLIPVQHQLRFVERGVIIEGTVVPKKVRILQQYQWSMTDSKFDWYDIPLVESDD